MAGTRSRALRAKDGGQPQGGDQKNKRLRELEKELRAALYGGRAAQEKHERGGQQRKPEWHCNSCGPPHFLERASCRRCGPSALTPPLALRPPAAALPRASGAASAAAEAPTTSARHLPPAAAASEKATALEQVLRNARAAGASENALAALSKEAADARKAVVESRPLGARLDETRQQLEALEAKAATARSEIAKAEARLAKLDADAAAAKADLAELEAAVAGAPAPQEATLEARARDLLAALERTSFADLPAVLNAMGRTHEALGTDAPEPPREDDALAEDALSATGAAAAGDAAMPATELLEELALLGDADDASYVAVARAAVTRQRRAPY